MRLEEALSLSPEGITTACPYCLTMFEDALKAKGIENVWARDIAEVVAASISL